MRQRGEADDAGRPPIETTVTAAAVLALGQDHTDRAVGFLAHYHSTTVRAVGALAAGANVLYGHDYVYDMTTALNVAISCGYGRSAAKPCVMVIGGEAPSNYHGDFVHSKATAFRAGPDGGFTAGHATVCFKFLHAIGAVVDAGVGGHSNAPATDCVRFT